MTVTLRRYTKADAEQLATLLNDEDVTAMTASIPYPYNIGHAREFLSNANDDRDASFSRAIVLSDNPETVVGGVTSREDRMDEPEIGYWIGKPFWGRGYASMAVEQFLALFAEQANKDRLVAQTVRGYLASRRVLEKNGFRYTGQGMCMTPARSSDAVPSDMFEWVAGDRQ